MGTLETIGVIDAGDVTTAARTKYRDSVVNSLIGGISLGAASLAPGSISMGSFETDPIDTVKQNYPAWHGFYIDGLQKNIAILLDLIPGAGILKPLGIFDPTEPVAIVISELQDLFLQIEGLIGIPVADILIAHIDVTIEKSEEITAAVENADPEAFFEGVKSTIIAALEAEGIDTAPVVEKIDEQKETIISKAEEIIEKAQIAIDVELPSLPVPSLDISFIDPALDTSPLFATIEANGYDGIGTKFIKMMTVFLSVPAKIVEAAKSAVESATAAIKSVVDALKLIVTNFTAAIQALLDAVIGFVWDLISQVLSIVSVAFLEISSIINIVFFFAKCFIISIIGFLLGPGLISLAAAKAFALV
jgi:hypothetical protein